MVTQSMLTAKERLDNFINKQRVAMYKPIQVAEILHRVRTGKDDMSLDKLGNVENYRNPSKRWRDAVTRLLIGQVSTSSQKYQDNVFEDNAVPPDFLRTLAEINNRFEGVVERYIYQRFGFKQRAIFRIKKYVDEAGGERFDLQQFLFLFRQEPGLKRSIDKAYELVVYALFNALLQELHVKVTVSVQPDQLELLREFGDFTRLVLGIDAATPFREFTAGISRAGVANAADRGLDMWANFGPAVQVKHVTLSEDLADEVAEEVQAEEIIIVCKDAEEEVIRRVSEQLGSRLRGIIKESDLISWYARTLSPQRSDNLGVTLIDNLRREFSLEFPFSQSFEPFYKERGYDTIPQPDEPCPFWEPDAWGVDD